MSLSDPVPDRLMSHRWTNSVRSMTESILRAGMEANLPRSIRSNLFFLVTASCSHSHTPRLKSSKKHEVVHATFHKFLTSLQPPNSSGSSPPRHEPHAGHGCEPDFPGVGCVDDLQGQTRRRVCQWTKGDAIGRISAYCFVPLSPCHCPFFQILAGSTLKTLAANLATPFRLCLLSQRRLLALTRISMGSEERCLMALRGGAGRGVVTMWAKWKARVGTPGDGGFALGGLFSSFLFLLFTRLTKGT